MNLVPNDLEGALQELGLDTGRVTEREVWALCPGHDDTRPNNFSVNRETGAYYCFACGFKGESMTTLVAHVLGLDAWSSAMWLRDNGASIRDSVERIRRGGRTVRAQAPTVSGYSIESEFAIFKDVPDKQLRARKLTREAADHYEIRWSKDGNFILPVHAPTGKLIGWQERTPDRPLNYPKLLAKSKTLFGVQVFDGSSAILVESPLDAARLYSEGYLGAVASFGAQVSVAQMRLIIEIADRLIVALDDDKAGHAMTDLLVRQYSRRIVMHVFDYGDCGEKDPGDMRTDDIVAGIENARYVGEVRPSRRIARR